MFTFLRKIRKSLIESGSTRRYLLYAIGEVALVVIGILIALQINNWNESRILQIKEEKILNRLLENLNSAQIQSRQFLSNEKKGVDLLFKALGTPDQLQTLLSSAKVDSFFYSIFWSFEQNTPVLNTYSDIKNSGESGLISNINIRERFSSLELSLNLLQHLLDDRLIVHQTRIDDIASNQLNFQRLLVSSDETVPLSPGQPIDYLALLDNQHVRNLLGIKAELSNQILGRRQDLNDEIGALTEIIEAELSGKK